MIKEQSNKKLKKKKKKEILSGSKLPVTFGLFTVTMALSHLSFL